MQRAYLAEQRSSRISCFKLIWELASGCGKEIVFPNLGVLCYLCVSLHVPVYDHAHHTARKTSLMLWMSAGQAAAVLFDGEGGQCSHAVALLFTLSGPGSAESQQLQPA